MASSNQLRKRRLPRRPSHDTLHRRVLHVINGEHYAGAERVQDLLAINLPEYGYGVGFACVKPVLFPRQRSAQDTPLYQTTMRSKFDFSAAKSLAEVCKIGGYDLIHAHTARSLSFGAIAARMTARPLIYHVHSPTSADSTRWLANRVNALFERICLTGVSRLICVSNSLADHMIAKRYSPQLMEVVPNGVPMLATELWDRTPPKDPWILGSVALFRPRKGIEVLLQALAQLRQRGHRVKLRAVGSFESESYESKIKTLAAKLDLQEHIDWVGFSSDINGELAKMDIMVLPSFVRRRPANGGYRSHGCRSTCRGDKGTGRTGSLDTGKWSGRRTRLSP